MNVDTLTSGKNILLLDGAWISPYLIKLFKNLIKYFEQSISLNSSSIDTQHLNHASNEITNRFQFIIKLINCFSLKATFKTTKLTNIFFKKFENKHLIENQLKILHINHRSSSKSIRPVIYLQLSQQLNKTCPTLSIITSKSI